MNYAYNFDGNQNLVQSEKKIWKDYTDLLINKNQAIQKSLGVLNGYTNAGISKRNRYYGAKSNILRRYAHVLS